MKRRLITYVALCVATGPAQKRHPDMNISVDLLGFLDHFVFICSILGCFIAVSSDVARGWHRWNRSAYDSYSPNLLFRPGDSGPKEAGPEAWRNGLLKVEELRKGKNTHNNRMIECLYCIYIYTYCVYNYKQCIIHTWFHVVSTSFELLIWFEIPSESFQACWHHLASG